MLRKITIAAFFIFMGIIALPQTPESFNYQAALKNSDGEMLAGQNVSVRISILQGSGTGSSVYSETHSAQTNDNGIINLKIGEGDNPTTDFSAIDWGSANYYLKIEMDETGGTSYTSLGASQLLSVPYALYSKAATNLGDDKVYTTASDTLFVVKDHDGNVVFAVFPDGAKVYVNETAKGRIGGFAVSGRNPTKAEEVDIFTVTADSTRIFVNETTKGSIGGFAVSGRNPTKGTAEPMFFTTSDSTRIFTQDTIGGFGVMDYSNGETSSYLRLTPLNYFIGHNSGLKVELDPLNPGMGKYNTFFGYETGKNTVSGFKNIFMGFNAGYSNISGGWNIFIGNNAGVNSQDGLSNIFIGDEAGYNFSNGVQNVFIGNNAGYSSGPNIFNNLFVGNSAGRDNVAGNYNTYVGISAGYNTLGSKNTFVGNSSGFGNTGEENTFLGSQSGIYTGSGVDNVCLGYRAGYRSSGSGNVFVGHKANYTFSNNSYYNCIAIGDSVVVTGNNQILIGNDNAASFYAQGIYSSVTGSAANLYIYASGRIVRSTSSKRYKKDIAPLEISSSAIYKLKPVSFSSKSEGTRHFGLIAEEVNTLIPELVDFAREKDVIPGSNSDKLIPDGVQYSLISVLLLKEVQKHESTINKQNEDIELLKKENQELKERLKRLEELILK